jgi:hypothetical protein
LPALARKMRPPRTTVCDSRQKTRAGGPFQVTLSITYV